MAAFRPTDAQGTSWGSGLGAASLTLGVRERLWVLHCHPRLPGSLPVVPGSWRWLIRISEWLLDHESL